MTRSRTTLLVVVLALVAWCGINYARSSSACSKATDGRMHATPVTALAPADWLAGDVVVCR